MLPNSPFWQQSLYDILKSFVTPIHPPEQAEEKRRVRALMSFLLALTILSVIMSVVRFVGGASLISQSGRPLLAFALYLLVRHGFYRPVIYTVIFTTIIAPFYYYLFWSDIFSESLIFYGAFSSMLLAMLFTNSKRTLQIVFINHLLILYLFLQLAELTWLDKFNDYVPAIFLSGIVIVIALVNERDVKQLKEQAQELNASQLQFRHLFDTFPEPIVMHINNRIIYANSVAEKIFQESHLVDGSIEDYVPGETIKNSQVDHKSGSMIITYEAELRAATGCVHTIDVTSQAIKYENELATLMLLQVSDESDRDLLKSIVSSIDKPFIAFQLDFENAPKISYVNAALCELTAYKESELINQPLHILERLSSEENTVTKLKAAVDAKQAYFQAELLQNHKEGDNFLAEWAGQIVYDTKGKAQYWIATVKDLSANIDERKESQIIQQALVSELGLMSLSTDSHHDMIEHAVIMCEQVLGIDVCAVFRYEPAKDALICVAVSQANAEFELHQSLSLDPESSQAAYALAVNQAVVSKNIQTESRFASFSDADKSRAESALTVVIPGRTQAYGVLTALSFNVQSNEVEEFLYFLQAVANILGSFAENEKANRAEREQREFAEALRDATAMINTRLALSEMLDKLMAYVRQLVPQVDSSSIMLWDVSEQGYRFIHTWGLDDNAQKIITERSFGANEFPLMQKMMNAHHPMILHDVNDEPLWVRTNDIERIRSYLGAPIIVQGECIGFFHLNSSIVGAFSEHDAMRLQTFADKTGTAISAVRYAQELEDLVKERTIELQKERERISTILETSGEGIFYVESYEIKFANQMLATITGYPLNELIGMDSRAFRPPDLSAAGHAEFNKMVSLAEVGKTGRGEVRLARKDGTIFYAGVTNTLVSKSDDGNFQMVTIVRDISQEKALENAKSRFIANAAHELRSPITSLKTRIYLIAKQPEKIDYHMPRLERIVGRMNRLVSDLLDMSYFEYGQVTLRPENVILQDVIERIVDILEPEAELEQLSLVLEMPQEPIHIWADENRIEQVITNLVVNAIHYTPQKGTVCVICGVDAEQNNALIYIKDTGEGIPQEHLEHIFEAFYRLDNNMEKKGTGLGLSISREIVELHHGSIRAESVTGEGSTFIVSIPLLET